MLNAHTRGHRRHRRRITVAAVVAVASLSFVDAPPSAAADAFCSLPGLNNNEWTGDGDGISWVDNANWSLGQAPNDDQDTDGYVCIDAGGTVIMNAGESAEIQAIDIASGTRLVLDTGSMLYVLGDHATRPSRIRQGATVEMKGVLGGSGLYKLDGEIAWISTPSGASTMSTRRCGVGATCDVAVPGEVGTLEVGDTGLLDIPGRGVNLFDEFRVVVRGTLRIRGASAYVAADRGTSLDLLPQLSGSGVGRLVLRNDGGWYEGRTLNGISTLSRVDNQGLIIKQAGTGTSVITATYTGNGSVQVQSGQLSLPGGVTRAATVGAATSYGFGACDTPTYGCTPVATTTDVQVVQVTTPARDTNGSTLVVRPDATLSPVGALASPVLVKAKGMRATRKDPAVIRLRLDASVVGSRTPATVQVKRLPVGATTTGTVPSCRPNGRPPRGSSSCIDRRGLANSSRLLADGDLLIVVRTIEFSSRWWAR